MGGGYKIYKHSTPNGVAHSVRFFFAPEELNVCRNIYNPKPALRRSDMVLYFQLITGVTYSTKIRENLTSSYN